MDLREIRIGNYFEISTEGQPCPDRLENGVYQWDNWYDYYEFGFNEKIFRPIPITEKWLERFGFENRKKKVSSGVIIEVTMNFIGSVMYSLNGTHWLDIADCNYVHQLQNLYFALTGEELNF